MWYLISATSRISRIQESILSRKRTMHRVTCLILEIVGLYYWQNDHICSIQLWIRESLCKLSKVFIHFRPIKNQ